MAGNFLAGDFLGGYRVYHMRKHSSKDFEKTKLKGFSHFSLLLLFAFLSSIIHIWPIFVAWFLFYEFYFSINTIWLDTFLKFLKMTVLQKFRGNFMSRKETAVIKLDLHPVTSSCLAVLSTFFFFSSRFLAFSQLLMRPRRSLKITRRSQDSLLRSKGLAALEALSSVFPLTNHVSNVQVFFGENSLRHLNTHCVFKKANHVLGVILRNTV